MDLKEQFDRFEFVFASSYNKGIQNKPMKLIKSEIGHLRLVAFWLTSLKRKIKKNVKRKIGKTKLNKKKIISKSYLQLLL